MTDNDEKRQIQPDSQPKEQQLDLRGRGLDKFPSNLSPRRAQAGQFKRSRVVLERERTLRKSSSVPNMRKNVRGLHKISTDIFSQSESITVSENGSPSIRARELAAARPDTPISVNSNASSTFFVPLLHVLPEKQALKATVQFNKDRRVLEREDIGVVLMEPVSASSSMQVEEGITPVVEEFVEPEPIQVQLKSATELSAAKSPTDDAPKSPTAEDEIIELEPNAVQQYLEKLAGTRNSRGIRSAFDAILDALHPLSRHDHDDELECDSEHAEQQVRNEIQEAVRKLTVAEEVDASDAASLPDSEHNAIVDDGPLPNLNVSRSHAPSPVHKC